MADFLSQSWDQFLLVFLKKLYEDGVFIRCVPKLILDVEPRLVDSRVVLVSVVDIEQANVALVDIDACAEPTDQLA